MNLQRQNARDHGMNVVAGAGLYHPVRMPVILDGAARGEHVFQLSRPVLTHPAATALVGGQAIGHGGIGGFLQVQVERGFDPHARLVHLVGAEAIVQLLPHRFLKPRGHRHLRLGNVQPQRCIAGLLGLRVGDDPVGLHLGEHQVATAQALLRVENRRISHWPLGQTGQQSRLGQRQISGVLGKVEFRSGLEAVHSAAQVDLIAIEGEDLLLGEGALDLDGQISLLQLATGGALGGEKEVAGQLHG